MKSKLNGIKVLVYSNALQCKKGQSSIEKFHWSKKLRKTEFFFKSKHKRRGESAAMGRRMRWANRLFSKIMKRKILNFLHEVQKFFFGNLCPNLIEKIGFPFFKKKKISFSRDKSKFFVQSFSLTKLAKLNFHF